MDEETEKKEVKEGDQIEAEAEHAPAEQEQKH